MQHLLITVYWKNGELILMYSGVRKYVGFYLGKNFHIREYMKPDVLSNFQLKLKSCLQNPAPVIILIIIS